MAFPQSVADAALIACGRHCCICHKFCGTKIELHHIRQVADGGPDTFENCIPLCFDCHAEMGRADPKHNKGKRYSETELIGHRDNWYMIVKEEEKANLSFPDDYVCEEDRKLFEEICEAFNSRIRYMLNNPNFYEPYESGTFFPLDMLLTNSEDPFFEFINPRLEEQKNLLLQAISSFIHYLYLHTYHIGPDRPKMVANHWWLLNKGYIRTEPFEKGYSELIREFQEENESINNYARELWKRYCDFVKISRKVLVVGDLP